MECVGLRYFNVFGPRQDPEGAYAAVIPKWIAAMIQNEPVYINGDGESSRDFCYVANAVQANLLAALADAPEPSDRFLNVAVGERTTLNQLFELLRQRLLPRFPHLAALRADLPRFPGGRCSAFARGNRQGATCARLRADASDRGRARRSA